MQIRRSTYLRIQSVVLVITVALIVVSLLWQPTGVWKENFVFGNLFWWFLLILVLEVAELLWMLRKFKDKARLIRRSREPITSFER
jgi:hypothetical protein